MPSSLTVKVRAVLREEEPDYNVFCSACKSECWGTFKRLYVQIVGKPEWTPCQFVACQSCSE